MEPASALGTWKIWQKLALAATVLALPALVLAALILVDSTDPTRVAIAFGAIVAELLFAVVLVTALSRGFSQQADAMLTVFEGLAAGDDKARATVITSDEWGVTAAALNVTLDKLQTATALLHEDAAALERGVLAERSRPFSAATRRLRNMIGEIQQSAAQVAASAQSLQQIASALSSGSGLGHSSAGVTGDAAAADEFTRQLFNATKQGTQAVQATIEGWGQFRAQAQATSQRMQRLADSAGEAGQLIQLLDDLVDRTSLAAVNATIRAASTSVAEVGDVCDVSRSLGPAIGDIERLCERAADGTRKTAALIAGIAEEARAVAEAADQSAAEAAAEPQQTSQASQAFAAIETECRRFSERLGRSDALANATSTSAKDTATIAEKLAVVAQELRVAASAFRLPETIKNPDSHNESNGLPTTAVTAKR
jgi:twitching motility protein PilJ